MKVSRLDKNSALQAGDELWILAEKKVSRWTQKIDWYLNFQVSKARTHNSKSVSANILDILKEEDLDIKTAIPSDIKSLMIPSSKNLPNTFTVEVPLEQNSELEWLKQIQKIWLDLKEPSLRIFLPKGFNENTLINFCELEIKKKVSYVVDLDV